MTDRARGKAARGARPPGGATGARYELFPHMADIGVRGMGPSLEAAFEQAALALTAVITEPPRVAPRRRVAISAEAPDRELLLVEWLDALIYEMALRHMLFGRYRVRVRGTRLEGEAWGEPVDVRRHEPAVEVKGATLTELEVGRRPDGTWLAQCVVDV